MNTDTKPHTPISTARSTCRACGGDMIDVWSMGALRINSFPKTAEEAARVPRVPLVLCRCHPCGLIQLRHTTNPDLLFGVLPDRPYWYRSGVNESMVKVLRGVVEEARRLVPLEPGDTVVDVGANDGTLLSFYPDGVKRVAYEPARNLHERLQRHCEVLVPSYFPYSPVLPPGVNPGGVPTAGSVKILTSIAMFYDLEDPSAFCREVQYLLHPKGVWVNQLSYLPLMLERKAWDGICHEHLTYWTYCSLSPLLAQAGLQVIKAELLPDVNEGSIRFYITHRNSRIPVQREDLGFLQELGAEEEGLGTTNEPYLRLEGEAKAVARQLRSTVVGAACADERVDILGASTKGNTLLQYCQLRLGIRQAIERSPEKVGRYTVNGIPIVSEAHGRAEPAKWLLVLPWHFRDSLIARERGKWPAGTKLLFPLPEVESYEL